ncbi:hypothetical protein KH172YL63_39120 [Bacillus sp. KH172YL63]|nr:hypothetical protein KH172YL63_39120 [Bacillus sp. KH172YL63]
MMKDVWVCPYVFIAFSILIRPLIKRDVRIPEYIGYNEHQSGLAMDVSGASVYRKGITFI